MVIGISEISWLWFIFDLGTWISSYPHEIAKSQHFLVLWIRPLTILSVALIGIVVSSNPFSQPHSWPAETFADFGGLFTSLMSINRVDALLLIFHICFGWFCHNASSDIPWLFDTQISRNVNDVLSLSSYPHSIPWFCTTLSRIINVSPPNMLCAQWVAKLSFRAFHSRITPNEGR